MWTESGKDKMHELTGAFAMRTGRRTALTGPTRCFPVTIAEQTSTAETEHFDSVKSGNDEL